MASEFNFQLPQSSAAALSANNAQEKQEGSVEKSVSGSMNSFVASGSQESSSSLTPSQPTDNSGKNTTGVNRVAGPSSQPGNLPQMDEAARAFQAAHPSGIVPILQ